MRLSPRLSIRSRRRTMLGRPERCESITTQANACRGGHDRAAGPFPFRGSRASGLTLLLAHSGCAHPQCQCVLGPPRAIRASTQATPTAPACRNSGRIPLVQTAALHNLRVRFQIWMTAGNAWSACEGTLTKLLRSSERRVAQRTESLALPGYIRRMSWDLR